MDLMVSTYRGLAVFQPVINGVGGNLVSVQSSRLSTELHKQTTLGTLPPDVKIMVSPITAFCSKSKIFKKKKKIPSLPFPFSQISNNFYNFPDAYALTARVLMSLVVPGHLVFIYTISWVQRGEVVLTWPFVTSYLFVSLIQVSKFLFG